MTPEKNPERPEDLAPETVNDEQDDEQSQAHEVAEDALDEDDDSPTESTKPARGAYEEDSTQDLVDHMRDMESSGRIDMGAFRGEPNMDDNEDKYGRANRLDDEDDDGLPSDGS